MTSSVSMGERVKTILVTGGAGYIGAVLVPHLLHKGYRVKVLDLYIYGDHVFQNLGDHVNLLQIKGDIRDRALLEQSIPGCHAIIHLACISNDPSFELDAELGKSINYDAFFELVDIARDNGVSRFIFASSSSVYGIKDEENVTEELALEPLTDYSKYKAMCEDVLMKKRQPGFATLILRPATVCGYSPRLRLDLTVNILTNHAVNNRRIKVEGGRQKRPNIHIEDISEVYVKSLEWPVRDIDGNIFNVGYENHEVKEIAKIVQNVVGDVEIYTEPTDDLRSYHISSDKIQKELGYIPSHTIHDAIHDLSTALQSGRVPNAMTDMGYYNVKMMQHMALK